MSELACPICHGSVHRIIGENIIVSIIGSRDTGKSHFIGILLHELMNKIAKRLHWDVTPELNTKKMYDIKFSSIYSTRQVLNLTGKNHDGLYELFVFYVTPSNKKTFTITFYDTAGEDFESTDLLETSARHTFHASGSIFLIDPLKIMNVFHQIVDEKANESSSVSAYFSFRSDIILGGLSHSLRHHYDISNKKKISIPMAITIPKIDTITELLPVYYSVLSKSLHYVNNYFSNTDCRNVNNEMQKWLKNLNDGQVDSFMSQLDINYSNYSYFASSALGLNNPPDKNGIFNTPNPHRIEDPLLWILKENGVINAK